VTKTDYDKLLKAAKAKEYTPIHFLTTHVESFLLKDFVDVFLLGSGLKHEGVSVYLVESELPLVLVVEDTKTGQKRKLYAKQT
jgi:hypothetical protein